MGTEAGRAFVLTPPGPAAIAVVRLVGPGVSAFLQRCFSRAPAAGRCIHGNLIDGARIIDDPVVVLLPDAAGADINLHGGPWVVRALLDLAEKNGFDVAASFPGDDALQQRGPFRLLPPLPRLVLRERVGVRVFYRRRRKALTLTLSRSTGARGPEEKEHEPRLPRVFDPVDGATLLEREVLIHLPQARTELGLRLLLAQPAAWEKFKAAKPAAQDLERILADRSLFHLLHAPTVAIAGAANVGKSMLANQLFGQERSITADVPGTTRDWVGEIANVDGLPVFLLDTPGLRATEDLIEHAAIDRSRFQIEKSEAVILVLDASRSLEPEQSPLLAAYPRAIRVVNKCDQPWAWDVSFVPAIHTIATTGQGLDAVRRAITDHFGCTNIDPLQPRWWAQRQREMLERQEMPF